MVRPVGKRPAETPLHANKSTIDNFVKGPGKDALGAGKPKFSTHVPKELFEKVTRVTGNLFKAK